MEAHDKSLHDDGDRSITSYQSKKSNHGYGSDSNSYIENSSYSGSETGSRKRRAPFSLQLQISDNSPNSNSNCNSHSHLNGVNSIINTTTNNSPSDIDDQTTTHTSRDTTVDGTFLSDSTSIAESKAEETDFDEYDLPSPTATAKAATNTEDVNEMLSQELLKMSLLDRTDIQEEIHGVRCLSVEETPELLRSSLQKFQRELDALPDTKKKTYIQVLSVAEEAKKQHFRKLKKQQNPYHQDQQHLEPPPRHYAVDDDDFRLRFLRAELFDSRRAVLRFVNYFEFVHEFWGFGIVSKRRVRLSDFSKEELKFFKKGYFQLLPFRDRSGRRVVVILGENKSNTDEKTNQLSYKTDSTTKAKCYFYLWDVASRDSVESQRKGVVAIAHPHGICFELQNHELYLVHRLSVSVPTRMVASHNFCLDFSGYQLLAKVVVAHVISGAKHKQIIRQKFHVGLNDTEMRYYLQGFGIPIQFFPLTETGTIKLNYFNKWLKTRTYLETREEEEEEEEESISRRTKNQKIKGCNKKKRKDKSIVVVECPLLNDVVFRQGKPYKANPGNDVLRDSILEELNRKMLASLELNRNCNNGNDRNNNTESLKYFGRSNSSDHTRDTTVSGTSDSSGGLGSSSTEHFCDWLVEEIEINRKGRFLTWDGTLNSWVLMSDGFKIRRKISVSLYNYEKRHSVALGKKITGTQSSTNNSEGMTPGKTKKPVLYTTMGLNGCISGFGIGTNPTPSVVNSAEDDDLAYRFIEGGKQSSAQRFLNCGNKGNENGGGERKRTRESF